MKNTINLILFFILLFLSSCKDEPITPKPETKLLLSVEDVSCTEAWVKLTTTNLQLPTSVNLLKDDNIIKTINLQTADTLLYIDSLLPNQTYSLQVSSIQNPATSNEVSVATMDTTSHNFTFETFEFGIIANQSHLFDVAIINENDIWAVGAIYINDSLGNPDPHDYNAIHWDGNEWELKRIYFPTVCGSTNMSSYPASSIFAFDDGKIWISSSGDKLAIIENGNQINKFCLPSNVSMSISKIWGTNSLDLYVVGNNGIIAHYNGSQWRRIESGTTSNIGDIWGISNGNGMYNKYYSTGETMIVLDVENEFTIINAGTNNYVNLIWGISNNLVYTAGNGVVLYKNNGWEKINIAELNTVYGIKGNNHNNVFGLSATSSIFHFNGYSWNNNNYFRLDVKNNLIAAVGRQGDKAAITLLKRSN